MTDRPTDNGALHCGLRCLALAVLMGSACGPDDRSRTEPIDKGVRHIVTHLASVPNLVHVIEVDLGEPSVELAVVKAGNRLRDIRPLSVIVREQVAGRTVIAAINGDFFSQEGIPSGAQFSDGRIVKDGPENWYALAITADRRFFVDRVHFTGVLLDAGGGALSIDGFNRPRQTDEVILYNSFFGAATNTNQYGSEITLRIDWHQACLGDTIVAEVVYVDSARGNSPLYDSVAVVSAHGLRRDFLHGLKAGDRVRLVQQAVPFYGRLKSVIGGFPLLVKNGKNVVLRSDHAGGEFAQSNSARTAIGFSNNERKLFLVCVDGSQPNYSVGMGLSELADFLIELGCEQAINLDGGGSSTLVVGRQVANRPSEAGTERAVSNALVLYRTERPR